MKMNDLYDILGGKDPLNLTFKDCFVSGCQSRYVGQMITSINYPEFREFVPSYKYVQGTVVVSDGFHEHTITFNSTGLSIEKSVKVKEISIEVKEVKPIGNYDVVDVDMEPICNYFGEGGDDV